MGLRLVFGRWELGCRVQGLRDQEGFADEDFQLTIQGVGLWDRDLRLGFRGVGRLSLPLQKSELELRGEAFMLSRAFPGTGSSA